VYGDGKNVRDWLYVQDHCEALDLVFHSGRSGEVYNIGGWNEWKNIDIVNLLCDLVDEMAGVRPEGPRRNLINFVTDRPGHDRRYAIDASKIERELGWKTRHTYQQGLRETIQWYISNPEWVASCL